MSFCGQICRFQEQKNSKKIFKIPKMQVLEFFLGNSTRDIFLLETDELKIKKF